VTAAAQQEDQHCSDAGDDDDHLKVQVFPPNLGQGMNPKSPQGQRVIAGVQPWGQRRSKMKDDRLGI